MAVVTGMDQVSVIVLSYNNLNRLKDTILSIIMQDYDNLEVILGDDGSADYNDELFARCESILTKNKNISVSRYHNEKNIGTIKNFNKAIGVSEGRWILPLSSGDTFAEKDIVRKIVNCFEENNALLVTARRRCINSDATYEIKPSEKQGEKIRRGGKELLAYICWDNFISGACTYYARELFEKVGFFDDRMKLLEDTPFYIKCMLNGVEFTFLNEVTINYDMNGVSSGEKINPVLEQDKRIMYQNWVFPYSNRIGKKLCRGLKARNYRADHKGQKAAIVFYFFCHPDTIIFKLYMWIKARN